MMSNQTSVVSLPLGPADLEDVVNQARDYASSHGIVMRTPTALASSDIVCHAPFTLFPSMLSTDIFEKALRLQEHMNLLMYRVSQDAGFLKQTLARTVEVDDFTRKLFQIYEQVRNEGCTKPVELGLLRTDYLPDMARKPDGGMELSMVEINTMASSFGGLAERIPLLHRFILGLCNKSFNISSLPDNQAVHGLAEGLVAAAKKYNNPDAVIVFVVSEEESNIFDQRQLEYAVRECDPSVKVIRRTLTVMGQRGQLRQGRRLFIDDMEVSVIYYRRGYIPDHFYSDTEWRAKLIGEQSLAAVCPSISWHLTGSKKIQQELARPGVVERFIPDPALAGEIRTTFVGQYPLDLTSEGDAAAEKGIHEPHRFVMKPQREGGGNNIYDDDVRIQLQKLAGCEERAAYILMDRIRPPIHRNYLVRSGDSPRLADVVSELGVFGTFVSHNHEVLINKCVGHLLRTKDNSMNEGGVSAGASSLDSPFLT